MPDRGERATGRLQSRRIARSRTLLAQGDDGKQAHDPKAITAASNVRVVT